MNAIASADTFPFRELYSIALLMIFTGEAHGVHRFALYGALCKNNFLR